MSVPPSQATDVAISGTGAPSTVTGVVGAAVPTRAVQPVGATGATPSSGRAVGRNTSRPVVGTAGSSLVTRKVIVTSRAPDSARDAATVTSAAAAPGSSTSAAAARAATAGPRAR